MMSGTSKPPPVPTIKKLIAAVMLLQIFLLLLRSWWQLELPSYGISDAVSADLSYLIVFPLMAMLFYPILRQFWSHLCNKLKFTNLSVKAIAIGIGVGLALRFFRWGAVIGGVSFGYFVNPAPGASADLVVRFGCPPYAVLVLSLFVMAILIPVVEEIINRGLLLEWLLNYGRLAALIFSSILFAMLHRPETIGIAFVFGLFAGLLYINSGSLWPSLFAHFSYNVMAVVDWDCINTVWNPQSVTDPLRGVGLLAVALALCSFALACVLVSKRIAQPSMK